MLCSLFCLHMVTWRCRPWFGSTLILGTCRDVDEICALLGYYAVSCGNCLPTFQGNISVTFSRVKSPSRKESWQPEPQCIRRKVRAVTGNQWRQPIGLNQREWGGSKTTFRSIGVLKIKTSLKTVRNIQLHEGETDGEIYIYIHTWNKVRTRKEK
jgi:hypothetical protein